MEKCYKLFVGGLPVRVDKDVIVDFFSKYGTVLSCKLKKNQQTGRSLGFAYLSMKEKEASERLLNEMIDFQGRIIEVKPVWKKKELGDRLEEEKRKKLFVSNLPLELTNVHLVDYFSQFGSVQNAFIIKDPDTKKNKNYGYVIFKEMEDLESAFSFTEPHMIKPGVELKLERCLNQAEIALLKQTNSYRSSMKSSYFQSPTNTIYNRNTSPNDFSSPERIYPRSEKNHAFFRSNMSPDKSSISPVHIPNGQSRQFKRSTFSIPKKKKKVDGFKQGPVNDRHFQFREGDLHACSPVMPNFQDHQIIRPHLVKGSQSPNRFRNLETGEYDSRGSMYKNSPKSSTKRSILALSERIDEREINYRFYMYKGDNGSPENHMIPPPIDFLYEE